MARPTLLTFTLMLLTGACTDDKNDSASASTGASETGSEPTGSETGGEPTTAGETGDTTDADETMTAPGPTGGDDTTGEPDLTTGGAPVEPLPECEALCAKSVECGFAMEGDGCVEGCSEQYGSDTQVCADATSTYLDCMASLTCREILESFEEPGPCPAEAAAQAEACESEDPSCGVGWGGGSGECELEIDCRGEPLRKMLCDDETCTCFVGEEQTGTCAAEAVCDGDAIIEKGAACCGF